MSSRFYIVLLKSYFGAHKLYVNLINAALVISGFMYRYFLGVIDVFEQCSDIEEMFRMFDKGLRQLLL